MRRQFGSGSIPYNNLCYNTTRLAEHLWRRVVRRANVDPFLSFIRDITRLYPF
jgi:hypothetical protein